MASDIPPSSLENKLACGAWDSIDFVSNEFRNPKIGNMDGCRNGILVEEEQQVFGNSVFVRGGGDYRSLSNGDYEGAGGPGTADSVLWSNSVLWGNWENSGNIGSVRQSGDSCSLSNSDFEGPEADFDIEGSGLRGNWKDGEDFMVDYLGSKIRIDCNMALLAVADWINTLQVECENFKETPSYRETYHDLTKGRPNEDNATFRKSQLTAWSNCALNAIKTCPDQHKSTLVQATCQGQHKATWNEDNATFRKNQLTAWSNSALNAIKTCPDQHKATLVQATCPGQHKATWTWVPAYDEPVNLNELIDYGYGGDYQTICWDAIEATRFEHRATTCGPVSCYEDDEPVKKNELVDKIESVDLSDKGAHLTSLKAGALLADFQGSGEAGFPRQLEESNDRWQESAAKNRDDTGNILVQAALGDLSLKTSAYYDSCQISQGETETVLGSMEGCSDGKLQREPHFGLFLSLSYLGLQDLMSVEKVCKSLQHAVKNDPLLWQSIHVERPLSERLTDDALLKLVERSQGHLRNLCLLDCLKITDDGLKQVLDISPNLTKLFLPGCTRLSADGIVKNVKAHRECSIPGVKQLRIGGLFGITREHLEKLNYLLDGGLQQKSPSVKPRFYNGRHYSLPYDDGSTIDIEACPKCGSARLVYDCPNESCQNQADHTVRQCRACTFCIARCSECGRCIDGEYEETFCLDMRCADCVRASQLPSASQLQRIERFWLW